MKIILLHGYKARAGSNFFPWLCDALHAKGHEVIAPDLPDSASPDPEVWTKFLLEKIGPIDEQTIIVGHSLGAVEALRFLEAAEATATPKACLLISPPWMIRDEKFRGFFLSELDFDVLMWKASRFVILHSVDDSVIPLDHARKYAKVLHAKLIERDAGEGHFQGSEYPIILQTIEELASETITIEPGEGIKDEFTEI